MARSGPLIQHFLLHVLPPGSAYPALQVAFARPQEGEAVRVEWDKRDRYGRIVGKVRVQPSDCPTCPMTLDAGQAQLASGMAWWYRKYAKDQSPKDRGRYEFEEQEARARRVGLWGDADPVPPWEWRRR